MINKEYEKFKGKICTIITQPTSFPFRDAKQHSEFFSGEVVNISEYGITIKHLNIGTLAFYAYPLIGIVEEQTISKTDPNYTKIKEQVEKQKEPKPIATKPQVPPANNFMSVEEMTKVAQKIKSNQTNTRQSS